MSAGKIPDGQMIDVSEYAQKIVRQLTGATVIQAVGACFTVAKYMGSMHGISNTELKGLLEQVIATIEVSTDKKGMN